MGCEHPLPLLLADLLAVVGSCKGFGAPFLLVEGLEGGLGCAEAGEVVEVVFVPCCTEFLGGVSSGYGDCWRTEIEHTTRLRP